MKVKNKSLTLFFLVLLTVSVVFTFFTFPAPKVSASASNTWQVSASSDDCTVYGDPNFDYFVLDGTKSITIGYYDDYGYWGSGLRFTGIAISHTAVTIEHAYLKVIANVTRTTVNAKSTIKGQNSDDTSTFSNLADFDARPRTGNYTTWNPDISWTQDSEYTSPDIKEVIQEIIDRPGWTSGNSIVLFWGDWDKLTTTTAIKTAYCYDQKAVSACKLYVEWSISDSTPPTYNSVGYNTTNPMEPCLFSCKWNDDTELLNYTFGTNASGSWVNQTGSLSGAEAWVNITKTLANTQIAYQWWAYDTNGNSNTTETFYLTVAYYDRYLYVNEAGSTGQSGWSYGLPYPYLDDNTTSITSSVIADVNSTWFGFKNTTLTNWGTNHRIFLEIEVCEGGMVGDDFRIYLNDGTTYYDLGSKDTTRDYEWVSFNVSSLLTTQTKINNAKAIIKVLQINFGDYLFFYARRMRLRIYYGPYSVSYGVTQRNAGQNTVFYCQWYDSDGLSSYILSHNNTGTWQNQSGSLTGTTAWSNVTVQLNSSSWNSVAYYFCANDSLGDWEQTETRQFYILYSNYNETCLSNTGSNTVSEWALAHSLGRHSFWGKHTQIYWQFYGLGNGDLVYTSSSNGIQWATPTSFRAGAQTTGGTFYAYYEFGASYDYVHYQYCDEDEGTSLYWRKGLLNNDRTVTWLASEQTVVQGQSNLLLAPSGISIDSSGHIFIGYEWKADTSWGASGHYPNMHVNVTSCALTNGTWQTFSGYPKEVSGDYVSLTTTSTTIWSIDQDNSVYVVMSTANSTTHYPLQGRMILNHELQSIETISNYGVIEAREFSAVSQAGNIHVVYYRNDTHSFVYCWRNATSGTWQIQDEDVTNYLTQFNTPSTSYSYPVISVTSQGYLYLFWATQPDKSVWGMYRNASGWSERQRIFDLTNIGYLCVDPNHVIPYVASIVGEERTLYSINIRGKNDGVYIYNYLYIQKDGPSFSNVNANTTLAGYPVKFYAFWEDSSGLSGFFFETNNTGTWITEPFVFWDGSPTSGWSNKTTILNSASGVKIAYQFRCNNTDGDLVTTGVFYLTTTSETIIIEIDNIVVADSRINVGDTAYIYFHARYSNNASDCPSGTIYVNGTGQAIIINGWAEYTNISSLVGLRVFAVTAVNVSDITAFIQVPANPQVIWDRMAVLEYSVSDTRANINATVNVDVTLIYEYDSALVTTGAITINGYSATNLGYGHYRIYPTSATVNNVIFNVVAGFETDYTLNIINQNGQSITVIWDRLQVQSYTRSDDRANVNSNVNIDVLVWFDYDDTPCTTATITINGHSATNIGSGLYRITQTSSSVTSVTYNTVACSAETTYGITVVDQNSKSTSVIWDRFEIISITASDTRIDVGATFELRCTLRYDYDDVIFTSSQGSISGFVWDSVNQYWKKTVTGSSSVGLTNYDETYLYVTDNLYQITAKQDVAGVNVITDRLLLWNVTASDTRINVGDTSEIRFKVRYAYDSAQFNSSCGTLNIGGVSASWDAVYGYWEALLSHPSFVTSTLWDYTTMTFTETIYDLTAKTGTNSISVITDKLSVVFQASKTNPQPKKPVTVSWAITRQYDGSVVTSFTIDIARDSQLWGVAFTNNSITDVMDIEGSHTYDVYISSVTDNTYNLTSFGSIGVTVTWTTAPPPPITIPPYSPPSVWQFLYEGDLLGFIQAIYADAFTSIDIFYAVMALIISMAIYIRTKSLILLTILAMLTLGGGLMVAMPLVAGMGVLLIIFGVAALIHRLFSPQQG